MGNAHAHVVQRLRDRESAHRLSRRDELLAYARCSIVSQQGDGALMMETGGVLDGKLQQQHRFRTAHNELELDRNGSIAHDMNSLHDENCRQHSADAASAHPEVNLPASSSCRHQEAIILLLGVKRHRRRQCSWRDEMENLGVADTGGQLGDFDPGDLGRSEDPTRNRENLYHRSSEGHNADNGNFENDRTQEKSPASLLLQAEYADFLRRPSATDDGGLAEYAEDDVQELIETPWTTKADFNSGEEGESTDEQLDDDDDDEDTSSDTDRVDDDDEDDEDDHENSVCNYTEAAAEPSASADDHNSSSSKKLW